MTKESKRYLERKFKYTIQAAKDGYPNATKVYLYEIQGIVTYLYFMDELSQYNYEKLHKLTYTIKKKYNIY